MTTAEQDAHDDALMEAAVLRELAQHPSVRALARAAGLKAYA